MRSTKKSSSGRRACVAWEEVFSLATADLDTSSTRQIRRTETLRHDVLHSSDVSRQAGRPCLSLLEDVDVRDQFSHLLLLAS